MSKAPIMPFYTDAYLADTHHLSTEAHGAYLLLLLSTWRSNGKPPRDDDKLLCSITKVPPKRWKTRIRPEIEGFFSIKDGFWRQKRLESTWNQVMEKSQKAREAALIRHNRPKNHQTTSAKASPGQLPSRIQDPESSIQPSYTPPQTPALDALKPILNDVSYFIQGGKDVPRELKPKLTLAKDEMEALQHPIDAHQLRSELARLWRHFPKRNQAQDDAALRRDYLAFFSPFPSDLVVDTINASIRSRPYPTLPPLAELDAAIQPRHRLRQKQAERLEKLINQVSPSHV